MPGGLLNLIGVGESNVILNGNPKKSFWKATYSKYTNFGLQKFRIDYNGQKTLNLNEATKYTFTYPRHGDLILDSFLAINIPHIWSPFFPTTNFNSDGSTSFIPFEFKWIYNLGIKLIQEIEITIGSVTIQKYSGDYLQSLIERDLNFSQKSVLNKMTGNTPHFHNPKINMNSNEFGAQLLSAYPNAVYDGSPGGPQPSISGETLYIPLGEWFSYTSKQAFPLVALQYNDLTVNITIRPVKELFRIRNVKDPSNNFRYTAPNFTNKFQQLYYFLQQPPANINSDDPIIYTEKDFLDSYIDKRVYWNNDIHLISTYVFLDDQEREMFARNNQQYLIKNIYENIFYGLSETSKIELNSNGLVAAWMWFLRRSDVDETNEWSNYTNWRYKDIDPSLKNIPSKNNQYELIRQKFNVLPNNNFFIPPLVHDILNYLKKNNFDLKNVVPVWPQQGSESYIESIEIENIIFLNNKSENNLYYENGFFYFNESKYDKTIYNALTIGSYKINNTTNLPIAFDSTELQKFRITSISGGSINSVKLENYKEITYFNGNFKIEILEAFTNLEIKTLGSTSIQQNFIFSETTPDYSNKISIVKNVNKLNIYVPDENNLEEPLINKIKDKDIQKSEYLRLKDNCNTRGIAAKIVLKLKNIPTEMIINNIKRAFQNVKWNITFNNSEKNNNNSINVCFDKNIVTVNLFYKIDIILQEHSNPIMVYGLIQSTNNFYTVDFSNTGLNSNDWNIDNLNSKYYVNVNKNDVWINTGGPDEGLLWNVANNNILNNKTKVFQRNQPIYNQFWGSSVLPYGFTTSGSYNENFIKRILKNVTILVDGKVREEKLPAGAYIYLESLLKSDGEYGEGLYFYNFQLKSAIKNIQPTGAMNLSKFKKIEFELELLTPPRKSETLYQTICAQYENNETEVLGIKKDLQSQIFQYTYNFHLFEERYNILTFTGGNAGLMYHL